MGALDYYYDFTMEQKIGPWEKLPCKEGEYILSADFEVAESGEHIFLMPCKIVYYMDNFTVESLTIDGVELGREETCAFVHINRARANWNLFLTKGKHHLQISGKDLFNGRGKVEDVISCSLIPALEKVPFLPEMEQEEVFPRKEYDYISRSPDTASYRPGLGKSVTPGRFGFSKGDGVLDFGMPTLGNIDKMYLCGHPKYKKPFRWSYSTMPENALQHGSFPPADVGIEEDTIEVNHLSVKWSAILAEEEFSCTYSLGTIGVITERPSGKMRISGLMYAGNYQYALLPVGGDKVKVVSLRLLPKYLHLLSENYITLFGATEFPDLPFMITFSRRPKNMQIIFDGKNGRLKTITFEGCPLMITATPFGIESFEPISVFNKEMISKITEKCRFWSRAFMAFPIQCEEYYYNDHKRKKTRFLQKFSYRYIEDEWGTKPLEIAVLPPVAAMSGVMLSREEDSLDFGFPTKYGPLLGALGNTSSYELPFMERARCFPFREKGSPLPALLQEGLKEYIDFVRDFDPGVIHYPFAGCLLEPYAFATTLMNFMDQESRELLRAKAGERLELISAEGKTFQYPTINWGFMMREEPDDAKLKEIYSDPLLASTRIWPFYKRKEPFTGAEFDICYINATFLSGKALSGDPEEIANFKKPMIENDWGVGMTFYYMYLSALASGRWDILRKMFPELKRVMAYFVNMNDFACLGSGYSDNAILWAEGGNYGAFSAFINMAEGCGDEEAFEEGIYLASRQFALRCALLRGGQHYFYKYFHCPPFYGIKFLFEEANPAWQFRTILRDADFADPEKGDFREVKLYPNRVRMGGVYNMTTEGIFPEIFMGMRKHLPEDMEDVFHRLVLTEHPENYTTYRWGIMQTTASALMDMALDPGSSKRQLLEFLEKARKEKRLMQEFRGIHVPSRRLPKNYLETQVLAWEAMKEHPAFPEHWVDLAIREAVYDKEEKKAWISFTLSGEKPLLRLGIREMPEEILLNGEKIIGRLAGEGKLELTPSASGKILFRFR